ncbi:MAG: hypothetical protein ABI193_11705 [Minicystis sp.]
MLKSALSRAAFLALFGSASLLLACGGKVVVDVQGAGGQGETTTSTSSVTSTSTSSVTSAVTSTGTSTTCTVQSCSEALGNGTTGQLCNPSSEKAYAALLSCICAGQCQTSCAANVCISMPLTPPCKACIGDPQVGCGSALNDCANN